MGNNRTAVLTSLALFAACSGKLTTSNGNGGSDPTLGTTGTTTGMQTTTGMDTTTGMTDPGPGGGAGTSPGFGGNPGPTACGNVSCAPGLICCNASCGVCVQRGEGCPAIACATADASADGTGGSVPIDFASFFLRSDFDETLDDSWFISGCAQQAGQDCVNVMVCPNQDPALDYEDKGAIANQTFPLGGVLGVTYAVSFKFNGLVEAKFYQGGQWALPDTDVATPGGMPPQAYESRVVDDTFYIGGTAIPSNYGVMRMRVLDSNRNEVGRYYMNAYPPNSGAESHRTFAVSYSHTIDVPGRGFVEYHLADSNCHTIDNCAPGSGLGLCDLGRNIPNEPAVLPTFPAMYTDVASPIQPHLVATGLLNSVTGAKQPWHSKLSHLTVTKVVAK